MMLPAMTIRSASRADLPQIFQLEHEAFAPYGTAESPEIISARLDAFSEGFLVAVCDATVEGYASSEKWLTDRGSSFNENPEISHQSRGHILCISALAVKEERRGVGMGSALLKRLIEIAEWHTCSKIILETTHAEDFYKKHGFKTILQTIKGESVFYTMQLRVSQL